MHQTSGFSLSFFKTTCNRFAKNQHFQHPPQKKKKNKTTALPRVAISPFRPFFRPRSPCACSVFFFFSGLPPKNDLFFCMFVCLFKHPRRSPMTSPLAGCRSSFLGLSHPKTPPTRLLRREGVKKQTLFFFFWVQMPNSWDLPPNLLKPPRSPPLRR